MQFAICLPNCLIGYHHWQISAIISNDPVYIKLFCICAILVCDWVGMFFFHLKCGVRQGGVLSPHFFAVYHRRLNKETSLFELCTWLLRPIDVCKRYSICWWYYSVGAIYWCTDETIATCWRRTCFPMALNASKSVCIRYGPRFDSDCSEISKNDGDCLLWVSTCSAGILAFFWSHRENSKFL